MTVLIAIQRDIVRAHGANAAIVHQQIAWVIEVGSAFGCEAHEDGWFTGTSEALAAITGLSSDQCRRAMAKLLEAGLMEKRKFRARLGDQTLSYRPVNPSDHASGAGAGSGDSAGAGSGDGDNAGSTSLSEVGDHSSPTPPEEGEQAGLFGAADSGAATRASKTRKRDEQARAFKGMFKPLWKKYPVLAKGKGKGSEAAALRAMVKALKDDQLTSADLLFRVENYVAARQAYEDSWGKPAPLMNASTFFNGKHAMFDHEWDSDDLTYWPAPEGRDWAKPRKRSVEDILADDPEGVDA